MVFKFFYFLLIGITFVFADTLFVDTFYCNDGYSIKNRDCKGADGKSFSSIQMALDSMQIGDLIYIRGGRYTEGHIRIPQKKNGKSWNTGEFNWLKSYPGEWAIIDGEKKLTTAQGSYCAIGWVVIDGGSLGELKYWKFDSLEICNGATSDGQWAAGFFGNSGPFWFRNCVFRNNTATTMSNNPGALTGYVWHDCIVEYCYFENNGAPTDHHNSAHINIYSDYNGKTIAEKGFVDKKYHIARNIYRYNLFVSKTSPAVAIKYKNDQMFTGRNPGAGLGYNDTYKNYGDVIHHNIFKRTLGAAIDARQDFVQIYNNIFDSCEDAIIVGEPDTPTPYKAVVYNNTVRSNSKLGIKFNHFNYFTFQEPAIVSYAYNNVIDNCIDQWDACDLGVWHPAAYTTADLSKMVIDRNFFYNPAISSYDTYGSKVILMGNTSLDANARYTVTEFETKFPLTNQFLGRAESGNSPFLGSNGSLRYLVNKDYKIEDKTLGTAGIGGTHPYLGTMLPKYIGAIDPNDTGWVSNVLKLEKLGTEEMLPVIYSLKVSKKGKDSITVKWDAGGANSCSLFVSINGAKEFAIGAKENLNDSLIWKIPIDARNLIFKVRAYNQKGNFAKETTSLQVSLDFEGKVRMYVYVVDSTKLAITWRSELPDSLVSDIVLVFRADHYADSMAETGNNFVDLTVLRGDIILDCSPIRSIHYFSIFARNGADDWGNAITNTLIIPNGKVPSGGVDYSDSLLVPFLSNENPVYSIADVVNKEKINNGLAVEANNLVDGKKTLSFTIPASCISAISGMQTRIIRSTAFYNDTIYFSKPVKRVNGNVDNFTSEANVWHPISVTAEPANPLLAGIISYEGMADGSVWSYDKTRERIIQWAPPTLSNNQNQYYEYDVIADAYYSCIPGRLSWIKSASLASFDFGMAVVPARIGSVPVALNKSGWTDFAIPIADSISLKEIINATAISASSANFDSLELYHWVESGNSYTTEALYLPGITVKKADSIFLYGGLGNGYTVFNNHTSNKSITIPKKIVVVQSNGALAKKNANNKLSTGWSVKVNARIQSSGIVLPSSYFVYSPYGQRSFSMAPTFGDVSLCIYDRLAKKSYGHMITGKFDASGSTFEVALTNKSEKSNAILFSIKPQFGLNDSVITLTYTLDNGKKFSENDSLLIQLPPKKISYITVNVFSSTNSRIAKLKPGLSRVLKGYKDGNLHVEFTTTGTCHSALVSVYDISGKRLARKNFVITGPIHRQIVTVPLGGKTLASGTYIVRLLFQDDNNHDNMFQLPLLMLK